MINTNFLKYLYSLVKNYDSVDYQDTDYCYEKNGKIKMFGSNPDNYDILGISLKFYINNKGSIVLYIYKSFEKITQEINNGNINYGKYYGDFCIITKDYYFLEIERINNKYTVKTHKKYNINKSNYKYKKTIIINKYIDFYSNEILKYIIHFKKIWLYVPSGFHKLIIKKLNVNYKNDEFKLEKSYVNIIKYKNSYSVIYFESIHKSDIDHNLDGCYKNGILYLPFLYSHNLIQECNKQIFELKGNYHIIPTYLIDINTYRHLRNSINVDLKIFNINDRSQYNNINNMPVKEYEKVYTDLIKNTNKNVFIKNIFITKSMLQSIYLYRMLDYEYTHYHNMYIYNKSQYIYLTNKWVLNSYIDIEHKKLIINMYENKLDIFNEEMYIVNQFNLYLSGLNSKLDKFAKNINNVSYLDDFILEYFYQIKPLYYFAMLDYDMFHPFYDLILLNSKISYEFITNRNLNFINNKVNLKNILKESINKNNLEFINIIICKKTNYIKYIPILNFDFDYIISLYNLILDINPLNFKYFIKQPTEITIKALNLNGLLIKYVKNINDEYIKIACKNNYKSVKYVKYLHEDLIIDLLDINKDILKYIKNKFHTKKIYEKAILQKCNLKNLTLDFNVNYDTYLLNI